MIASGVRAKVQEYIDGVMDGSLLVSDRVRDAVNRHVSDLWKQSTSDFPYHFDDRHASHVCQFFPMLLRHSIGPFAGMPLELSPFQLFCTWSIFGWKRDVDDTRRFRKVYISLARKNGKSTWMAGICHFAACADIDPKTGKPESVAQILLAATKKEQAKVVYSEAERMRLQSPTLKNKSRVRYETITYEHNQSYIRTVGSDKPFDGMNPHVVVADELHAWQEHHRPFYDTMVTGSGARSQPLFLVITTAGDDTSHLWLENYQYACNVVKGVFRDDSLFAFIAELDEKDDPGDESLWIKSNPNLGVSVSLDYLKQRWNEDKATPIGQNRFTRYHGNRLVTSTAKAFDLGEWDACAGEFSDWSVADAICAGIDLGSRDDFAAYALCARFLVSDTDVPVYRYEIDTKCYIAADSKRDLTKMPFAEWIHNGNLRRCQYPIAELKEDLLNDCKQHVILTIGFDPYNGQQIGEELGKENLIAASVAQNHRNFNEPIREFLKCIQDRRFLHNGNPLLKWCAGNAVVASDVRDHIMFDKRTSTEKIDPIVAAVMAFRLASLAPTRASGSLFIS